MMLSTSSGPHLGSAMMKPARGAFDHNAWFALPGLSSGVSPFFADLLYQQPVALFNDWSVMPLNEILRFQSVVFDALVCKEIYRYCFLRNNYGIDTI